MRCRLYAVGIQLFGKTSWKKYLGEIVFHRNQDHNEGLLNREHSLNKHYAFVFMVLGIELKTSGTKDKWLMTELHLKPQESVTFTHSFFCI